MRCGISATLMFVFAVTFSTPIRGQTMRESVSFGQQQMNRLLLDRQSMRSVIPNDHAIRKWIVERFERGAMGERVYWDRTDVAGCEASAAWLDRAHRDSNKRRS